MTRMKSFNDCDMVDKYHGESNSRAMRRAGIVVTTDVFSYTNVENNRAPRCSTDSSVGSSNRKMHEFRIASFSCSTHRYQWRSESQEVALVCLTLAK